MVCKHQKSPPHLGQVSFAFLGDLPSKPFFHISLFSSSLEISLWEVVFPQAPHLCSKLVSQCHTHLLPASIFPAGHEVFDKEEM